MEYPTEKKDRRSPGMAGKIASAAVGAGAGLVGMVLHVNHSIASNFRKPLEEGLKALDREKAKLKKEARRGDNPADSYSASVSMRDTDDFLEKLRTRLRSKFSVAVKNEVSDEVWKELEVENSTLGKAFKTAMDTKSALNHPELEFLTQMLADASTMEGANDPHIRKQLNNVETLVIDMEKHEMKRAMGRLPSHIPLADRLRMAEDLHLSGNQKTGAVIAFAGVAAVAAGAMYYGLKQRLQRKADMDAAYISF